MGTYVLFFSLGVNSRKFRFQGNQDYHNWRQIAGTSAGLDIHALVRDFYRMKATTMTLSEKRQSVFPQEWCKRVGLDRGGPVNVFDLGNTGLLIRPVIPPTQQELEAALTAACPQSGKPGEAEQIVADALRNIRERK